MANPTVDRSQRHVRSHHCPVCDGFDEADRGQGKRCSGFTTADGSYCNCSREDYAGAIAPNAAGLYGHRMQGSCKCGTTHGEDASIIREKSAEYVYQDERGRDVLRVCILGHGSGKKVWQQHWDGHQWQKGRGTARRILYRLPELLASTGAVYVVEGERDVETLRARGYTATCNAEGAGKWRLYDASPLRGREIRVVADKDGEKQGYAGQKHALDIQKSLEGAANVTLWQCPEAKDVTDHFAAGGTIEELVPMAAIPAEATSKVQARPSPLRLVDGPAWGDEEPPGPQEETRPEIVVSSQVHEMIDSLEGFMAGLDAGLYQRVGRLVTTTPASRRKGIGEGAPVIVELSQAAILPRITRHVQFVRVEDAGEKACARAHAAGEPPPKPDVVKCTPPAALVVAPFVAGPHWPNIRDLVGVTESPLLRADGTVCQVAGYDSATGYLVVPACDYPKVEEHPTQGDARAALADLLDVFCDFPYVDDESRLVPIASLLTIFARAAIDGPCPAFLFDASVRGSGKTLQCDVVHMIGTGRGAAHAAWPNKDEERQKLLAGYALMAPQAVVIDNIKGIFGGPDIEQTLTSTTVEFRVLGSKDVRRMPWLSAVMASGNNIQLTDDMLRRTLLSRLETPLERPEDRPDAEFAHPDLIEWIKCERPRLVASALTMLRAYTAKLCPDTGVRMASYQAWAKIVAGAIKFAGGADVTKARPTEERAAAEDVTHARTIAMRLDSWAVPRGTLKQILQSLWPHLDRGEERQPDAFDDLREAFEGIAPSKFAGQMPSPILLSRHLRKFAGRWFDNRKIHAERNKDTGVCEWSIVKK